MLNKNVAGQKWRVFAFDTSANGAPKAGDAAQITAKIAIDWAAAAGVTDTNPTETEDGYYLFDLTQAETNGDKLEIYPESSTANIVVVGDPSSQDTWQVSSTAAAALEDQYDGTGLSGETYPATQAQVSNIGSASGGAVNFEATEDNTGGAIKGMAFVGSVQSGTYASTESEDGIPHEIDDVGNVITIVYGFDIGGDRQANFVSIMANVDGNVDEIKVKAYDFVGDDWEIVGTITGSGGASYKSLLPDLLSKHTGFGADLGKIYIAFDTDSTTPATLQIDKCLVAAVSTSRTVGYSQGAIWVDSAGNAGVERGVNGTADNPCPWANALTLNSTLKLNRFHIANDNTVTLAAACEDKTLFGEHWYLALGGQSINDSSFAGAQVSGIGSAANHVIFRGCSIDGATIPPCEMHDCGIGLDAGTFTAASAGEYIFHNCFSLVPGSGSPSFVFTGLGSATGINNRGWHGGSNYTLDTNCTMSHEVSSGGGTTITPADADVELRGLCRSITINLSDTDIGNTIQVITNTGPVTITASGASDSATINLYGTAASVTDGSSNGANNEMITLASINAEADTALTDYDPPTMAELTAAFTEIKGATWNSGTDTLEDIVDGQVTPPTVEQVRTEMDSNSTQLSAIVGDTGELQTDWTNGGRLDLIIDSILADTNEMQTDLADGGRLDLLIDAVLADTNELQTDLTDGGRLDLLIDGIKAVTDALTVAAAIKLALSVGSMTLGTVEAGTLSVTQMTTNLTAYRDNRYKDSLIAWLTGPLVYERSEVTSSVQVAGLITHPATTVAPEVGDTFLLI